MTVKRKERHTVCQVCNILVHKQMVQIPGASVYHVRGTIALTREAEVGSTMWLPTDYLVTSTGVEHVPGGLLWHTRIHNIDRGVTRALCFLPPGAIAFCPFENPALTDNLAPSWHQFVNGRWTHSVPERPGLYPIRGSQPPVYLHTVRIALRKDGPMILGENDGEVTPGVFTSAMWIWSDPMPALAT